MNRFIGDASEVNFNFDWKSPPGITVEDAPETMAEAGTVCPPWINLPPGMTAPTRCITSAERRVNFAAIESEIEAAINAAQLALGLDWVRALDELDSKLRKALRGPGQHDLKMEALRQIAQLQMNLAPFVAEFTNRAIDQYKAGAEGSTNESRYIKPFDWAGSPELGRYAGLAESKSFEVARGMEQQALSVIASSFQNSFDNGLSLREAMAKYQALIPALKAGQFTQAGTPGADYSKPAVQETTVRTIFNDSQNAGRFDVFARNPSFVLGIMRSELIEPERNHPLSPIVDGMTIRMSDPRIHYFKGAMHFGERGVAVPITVLDAEEPGFRWSTDSEIDNAIARGKVLSPRFFR